MAAFARISLIIMNFIFLLCGIILFAFGIWMAVDDDYLVKFGSLLKVDTNAMVFSSIKIFLEEIQQASYILMACGLCIFVIAILGFCGAIKQTVCFLILYCSVVVVLILVQEGIAVFVIFNQQQVKEAAGQRTVEIFSKQYVKTYDQFNSASKLLDYFQVDKDCCGINRPTDYDKFTKWRDNFKQDNISDKSIVPITCCGQHTSQNLSYVVLGADGSCPNSGRKQNGCLKPVIEQILTFDSYLIGSAVVVALIETVGIVLALYIAFNVHKNSEYKEMK